MSRTPAILLTAGGSLLVGMLGAFLVWNQIYAIGASVVDDGTYARLHDDVVRGGGFAGAFLAVWVAWVLGRTAIGFLCAAHVIAMLAGFVGGYVDWKVGLWSYFGALGFFAVATALRRKRTLGRRRKGGPRRVTDGPDGGWEDGGEGGCGWGGEGDGGCDGGGGD